MYFLPLLFCVHLNDQDNGSNDESAVAEDEDKDARARKALVDESDEEAGTDNDDSGIAKTLFCNLVIVSELYK